MLATAIDLGLLHPQAHRLDPIAELIRDTLSGSFFQTQPDQPQPIVGLTPSDNCGLHS